MGIAAQIHRTIFRSDAMFSPIPPESDLWYGNPGYGSDSGMRVSPETALRIGAVFSCVRVVSETMGSMPLIVYKRNKADGSKQRALDHPLYHVLHSKPNDRQTSMEFVEMMQAHLELRGNAFALICPGPDGAIQSLIPLHPDRVNVYRLSSGRLRYEVRSWWSGDIGWYNQEDMFHLRGISADGIVGMSTIAVGREIFGNALAQQEYAARFLANDAAPHGVLKHPGKLSNEARVNIKKSWHEGQGGANRHGTALMEDGMEYVQIGLNNKDSQFLEARQFSRTDIAAMFRIPPHKIGDLSRGTFSNIEQQSIEFVTDSMRPRAVRWERRINIDLLDALEIGEPGEYFAEFLMDALLRGDLKSRYEAYAIGYQNHFLCPNDICAMENRNPLPPGQGGDVYMSPVNMAPTGAVPGQAGNPAPGTTALPEDDKDEEDEVRDSGNSSEKRGLTPMARAMLNGFAKDAAERVVRKEVKALRKSLARVDGDRDQFICEAEDFYATHGAFVSEVARIPRVEAEKYILENKCTLNTAVSLAAALDSIEKDCPEQLAETALGSLIAAATTEVKQ
jgi:HK97 family phage portal protein